MSYVMYNFGVFPAISDSYLFPFPILIGSSNFIRVLSWEQFWGCPGFVSLFLKS